MRNKPLRKVLLLLLVIASTIKVWSTEQTPDLLVLGKDTVYLKSFPLEKLSFKIPPFKYGDYFFASTSCWRGYQAIWTIENNKLFLVEIIKADSTKTKLNIEEYFLGNGYKPNIHNGKIFADWYSANLEDFFKTFNKSYIGYNDKKCLFESYRPKERKTLVRIKNGIIIENKMKIKSIIK